LRETESYSSGGDGANGETTEDKGESISDALSTKDTSRETSNALRPKRSGWGRIARDCTEAEASDPTKDYTTAATGTTIGRYRIALDSCSAVSIVHPRFLNDINRRNVSSMESMAINRRGRARRLVRAILSLDAVTSYIRSATIKESLIRSTRRKDYRDKINGNVAIITTSRTLFIERRLD